MGILLITIIAIAALAFVVAIAPAMADPSIQGPVDTGKVLQATQVTKTASFNSTGVDFGSGYAPGGGGVPVQAAVPISAADFASLDETYTFKIQESDDDSTYTDAGAAYSALAAHVGSSVVVSAIQRKRYLRLVMTAAGTTPSITYGPVYVVPQR